MGELVPPKKLVRQLEKMALPESDPTRYTFSLGTPITGPAWAAYHPLLLPNVTGKHKTQHCDHCFHSPGTLQVGAGPSPRGDLRFSLCAVCAKTPASVGSTLFGIQQGTKTWWIRYNRGAVLTRRLTPRLQQWLSEQPAHAEHQFDNYPSLDIQALHLASGPVDIPHLLTAIVTGYLSLKTVRYKPGGLLGVYLSITVARTDKPCRPTKAPASKGPLPWTETYHYRMVQRSPIASYCTWLNTLDVTHNLPDPAGCVNLVRNLAKLLTKSGIVGYSTRYELRQLLRTQDMLELYCAMALVRPVYAEGKLVRLEAADPNAALAVVQRVFSWPGALTEL